MTTLGPPSLWIYLSPLLLIWGLYAGLRFWRSRTAVVMRDANRAAGLIEPPSLHPVIDPSICIGCAACAKACPEGKVLAVINGKAELVKPTSCIGHGACKAACPMDAIELVFGTERRGVDIPMVKPNFETNVPGIFIAGELGGMGLIRNAIEQGRQAMDAIRDFAGSKRDDLLDVVIVGAGPAGFSATLAALEQGLSSVTVEQESLGGTVAHYPRGKLVMTAPAHLPIIGKVKLSETSKEELLEFWTGVEQQTGIEISYAERVEKITEIEGGFEITTNQATHRARSVLLAIGRRGTPRKLGVEGEQNSKVVYRLIDPEQYQGKRVLVVGGGDSALEAAISISEEPGTTVTVSYRSEAFSRAKEKNRQRIKEAVAACGIELLMSSTVKAILHDRVQIEVDGGLRELENDAVIVCAGGILPTGFLKAIGISVETKYGSA